MAAAETQVEWQPARLFPVAGIRRADEAEGRATSALLAVLPIVEDYASSLLKPFGALRGAIETYIEVEIEDGSRPDGAIVTSWGSKQWNALVEVKTGDNPLQTRPD